MLNTTNNALIFHFNFPARAFETFSHLFLIIDDERKRMVNFYISQFNVLLLALHIVCYWDFNVWLTNIDFNIHSGISWANLMCVQYFNSFISYCTLVSCICIFL